MHKLMEYICEELEELERKADKEGKLSMAEVQYGDTLAHFKKSLLSADEMWEESEYSQAGAGSGQSRRGGGSSYARGGRGGNRGGGGSSYYDGGSSYEGGSSYARGRGRGARRDSMGRYSREGGSYDMSMAEDEFRMELQELMQDAPNEQIKQKIQRLMSEM